jgi:hypothetical protein
MKHADYLFQTLEDVLKQIYKFHLSHPKFFFLDFDFNADLALSNKIADIGKPHPQYYDACHEYSIAPLLQQHGIIGTC